MGDYYFPALINPSIGFEPTPLPYYWQRASITPRSNIYMAYLHNDGAINHRIVQRYRLWYTRGDSNPYCFDPKSNASCQLGYLCIIPISLCLSLFLIGLLPQE